MDYELPFQLQIINIKMHCKDTEFKPVFKCDAFVWAHEKEILCQRLLVRKRCQTFKLIWHKHRKPWMLSVNSWDVNSSSVQISFHEGA